jgi:hypothetical protein
MKILRFSSQVRKGNDVLDRLDAIARMGFSSKPAGLCMLAIVADGQLEPSAIISSHCLSRLFTAHNALSSPP